MGGVPHYPISVPLLSNFIAFLFQKGYAPSSITTYVSAIGYQHRIRGLVDPSCSFYILSLLSGARRLQPSEDSRLPLTKDSIIQLIQAVNKLPISRYQSSLLKCMYLLAFHAFARVGEITVCSKQNNVLLFKDVELVGQELQLKLIVNFRHYKHNSSGRPFQITLKSQPAAPFCPILAYQSYATLRGSSAGPLFLDENRHAVTRQLFTKWLKASLSMCGLNSASYKGHSFRIGAATWAAEQGLSDAQIRHLGRWKSNAFRKYIRPVSGSYR